MEDKTFRITEAQHRKNWQGQHGEMADYAIKLEGVEGWVQLTQKPDTPAPVVGQELFGHTWVQTNGDKSYLRFKKVSQNFNGGSRQQSSGLGQILDVEYITKLLEAIAEAVDAKVDVKQKDVVVEDIDDKPIDLSEIPF